MRFIKIYCFAVTEIVKMVIVFNFWSFELEESFERIEQNRREQIFYVAESVDICK